MPISQLNTTPSQPAYDVVIIGGAIMGAATAWFLSMQEAFDGTVLVIERDPGYGQSSTAHTNSCMRQQFSTALNVQISQFAAEFVKNLGAFMRDDRVPALTIQNFGYLYLAATPEFADVLHADHKVQRGAGAMTELLDPGEIAARYPFYALDDILMGSINRQDEGYWDGGAVFDWLRRSARDRGVEFIAAEVTGMTRNATRIDAVTLANGHSVACGQVVNATGPRAARTAAMAGISLPVEPRKRFTWVFSAQSPLDRALPLTIDPSGVHVRQDGPQTYMVGCAPSPDPSVAFDDFSMDHTLWETHVWPTLAHRIPAFESIRVVNEWAGHYAFNTLDQNAVLGPHDEVTNFLFINGFSGHGLQQSPAMGRGLAEWITFGEYRSLDLTPFGFARVRKAAPLVERAVI